MDQIEEGKPLFGISLDSSNSYMLKNAASWAKVFGVASLVIGIFLVLMGVLLRSVMGSFGSMDSESSALASGTIMITYIISAIIVVAGGLFAFNFGSKVSKALNLNDQELLNSAFASCRNFFALWAIINILGLCLLLLSFAGLMMRL